jgi:Adenylate cyclase associated (CAP) C terminal
MINIDHVDQATIYLSKPGLDVEIITSSTTGINVILPPYCFWGMVNWG